MLGAATKTLGNSDNVTSVIELQSSMLKLSTLQNAVGMVFDTSLSSVTKYFHYSFHSSLVKVTEVDGKTGPNRRATCCLSNRIIGFAISVLGSSRNTWLFLFRVSVLHLLYFIRISLRYRLTCLAVYFYLNAQKQNCILGNSEI